MKLATLAVAALAMTVCLFEAGGKATATRALRVGYVTPSGVVPTKRELGGLMLAGFLRADRKLPIDGRVVYVSPNQGPSGALASLAGQKYDLIVAGFSDVPAVYRAAREFPHVRFLLADAPLEALPHHPKNVEGTIYRAEEAGYLAGYLAALMEHRRRGSDVISAVGGFKFSGVTRWIVGYKAGAKKAERSTSVRVGYSNNFSNPAKCRSLALSQIARGSGVVFNIAGLCGLGALRAAKEKGVWGVGVDVDQSYLGRHILTSAVTRTDNGVFATIRRLVRGRFTTGGDLVFNLGNGGVELGRINPKVPRPFVRRVEDIRRAIIAGKIRVPRVS
jgi:basic membrane protein A and related proteins